MTLTDLSSGKKLQKLNNPTRELETFRRPLVENFQRRLTDLLIARELQVVGLEIFKVIYQINGATSSICFSRKF